MATTTNYSWTTPDDTDLVKDGASAIRSLGSAIDSTVFTNAGNAVQKSTIDAKGDLLVGTADNTITRLAVGTNNYVLTADSAEASGVKWAAAGGGGFTLLSTTTLSSTSTTISSISQSYSQLLITGEDMGTVANDAAMRFRFNGITASNYQVTKIETTLSHSSNQSAFDSGANDIAQGNKGAFYILIPDYASGSSYKYFEIGTIGDNAGRRLTMFGYISNTSSYPVDSFTITTVAGTETLAGTVKIYGA